MKEGRIRRLLLQGRCVDCGQLRIYANHLWPVRPSDCQRCHTTVCRNKRCARCETITAGGRTY